MSLLQFAWIGVFGTRAGLGWAGLYMLELLSMGSGIRLFPSPLVPSRCVCSTLDLRWRCRCEVHEKQRGMEAVGKASMGVSRIAGFTQSYPTIDALVTDRPEHEMPQSRMVERQITQVKPPLCVKCFH